MNAPTGRRALLLPLSFLLPLLLLSGCGDSIQQAAAVQIDVTPNPVTFASVPVGEVEEQIVQIRSISSGTLVISEFSYQGDPAFEVLDLGPLTLEAGAMASFRVRYAPTEARQAQGTILLNSNAGNQAGNRIQIQSQASFSELVASPNPVQIHTDRVGQTVRTEIELYNRGSAPFDILDIRLFSPWADLVLEDNPVEPGDPPMQIGAVSADNALVATLAYTPETPREFTAELVVRCTAENCGENQRIIVPIEVSSTAGALDVDPDPIGFGAVAYGEAATQTVRMINVGDAGLIVDEVWLRDRETGEADPTDLAITDFDGRTWSRDDSGVDIPVGEERTLELTYLPTLSQGIDAELVFLSNDPLNPEIVVPVGGTPAAPVLEVRPQEIEFGTVARSITARVTLRVRNAGASDLTIGAIASPANQYTAQGVTFRLEHPTLVEQDLDASLYEGINDGRRGYTNLTIAPGEEELFTVSFAVSQDADVFVPFDQNLIISDVNDETVRSGFVFIPITGRTGDVPECELTAVNNPTNFGLLIRGTSADRTVRVRNVGTGNCVVNRLSILRNFFGILPGTGDYFSHVASDPARFFRPSNEILAPREEFEATLRYEPFSISPIGEDLGDQAYFGIEVTDAYSGDTVACAGNILLPPITFPPTDPPACAISLRGFSGVATLATIPGRIDTGPVTLGCSSQVETMQVYSIGTAPVTVTDIRTDGCGGRFQLANLPVLPRTMEPEDQFAMSVRYRPDSSDNGVTTNCRLIFEGDMDSGEHVVPLRGSGTNTARTVDEFEQNTGRDVDVLFVIDNSGSMGDLQNNLSSNIDAFVAQAELLSADFQFGVVTTQTEGTIPHANFSGQRNPGELLGTPRIITPSTPNAAQQFRTTVLTGTSNSPESAIERGFESARLALSDPLITDFDPSCSNCPAPYECVDGGCGGFNRGFLRDNAALQIFYFSDEEEQSRGTLDFYVDFFKSIKGFRNESLFAAHSITGPRDRCCGSGSQCENGGQPGEVGSADPAPRYVDMTERTGGVWGNICNPTFSDTLAEIGAGAFAQQVEFFLSRVADPSTIVVQVQGEPSPAQPGTHYQYVASTNSIVWQPGSIPAAGTRFTVTYDADCL